MNIWRGQMELHRDKVGQTLEAKENMMGEQRVGVQLGLSLNA